MGFFELLQQNFSKLQNEITQSFKFEKNRFDTALQKELLLREQLTPKTAAFATEAAQSIDQPSPVQRFGTAFKEKLESITPRKLAQPTVEKAQQKFKSMSPELPIFTPGLFNSQSKKN